MLTIHLENEVRSRSSRIGGSPAKSRKPQGKKRATEK
jgi:hypothetical protein